MLNCTSGMLGLEVLATPTAIPRPRALRGCDVDFGAVKDVGDVSEGGVIGSSVG